MIALMGTGNLYYSHDLFSIAYSISSLKWPGNVNGSTRIQAMVSGVTKGQNVVTITTRITWAFHCMPGDEQESKKLQCGQKYERQTRSITLIGVRASTNCYTCTLLPNLLLLECT